MAKRKTATVSKLPARRAPVVMLDTHQQLIQNILEAAANPKVNAEKFKALMDMKDKAEDRAAKIAFDNALAEMQPELPVIDKKGRLIVRKKDPRTGERTGPIEQSTPYAKWEDIMEAIRPILHRYGFSLTFRTPDDPSGKVKVMAVLARGGHREETTLPFQHDSTGSKNAAQAIVSSVSYGKKTVAGAILNVITRGEDDDGKKAEGLEPLTPQQVSILDKLVNESGADLARFLALFAVDSLGAIPQLRFNEAKGQLNRKLRDKKAREAAAKKETDFPGDKPMKTEPPKNEFR